MRWCTNCQTASTKGLAVTTHHILNPYDILGMYARAKELRSSVVASEVLNIEIGVYEGAEEAREAVRRRAK